MRHPVFLWEVSSFFGWGIYGLNLALHWSVAPDLAPACGLPVNPERIVVDALRRRALEPFLARSARLQSELAKHPGKAVSLRGPLLVGLGTEFLGAPAPFGVSLRGSVTAGVTFFERPRLSPQAVSRAQAFDVVITGSTWNERLLRAHGVDRVRTVLQGIDPTLFHPAPRAAVLPSHFLVFSGGKLESRKGQDIVLAAFRRFAARHPEALLVTAWHSPWPKAAQGVDRSGLVAPVRFDPEGRLDVLAWAEASGVPRRQILDLGAVPNAMMPPILREMDVAVFPNRAEGGTNLVAMECMACGLPVVLSRNTGHLDLIRDDNCYTLDEQRPFGGDGGGVAGVEGWGDSSVEELDYRLEQVWSDRTEAARRGARAARTLSCLTWQVAADNLRRVLEGGA